MKTNNAFIEYNIKIDNQKEQSEIILFHDIEPRYIIDVLPLND